MTRRGKLLEHNGTTKVTRSLANRVPGLRPLVCVFDEAHELFEHDEYGKEAGPLAVRVAKKARKCGITILFLTQSPTASSIPKDLTRQAGCGVAFSVADHVANDGLLGSGRYRAGVRATELRRGDDRGTAVTVGLTANPFELVRTFYVALDEGDDQVSPVIARAMAGVCAPAEIVEAVVVADHLADIRAALRGEPRVRTQTVLARLVELNPGEYESWTFQRLTEALAPAGVSAHKSGGVMVVRAGDVARALIERADDEV